jgi:hypothetical protein
MSGNLLLRLISNDTADKCNISNLDSIIGQTEVCKKLRFFAESNSKITPFPNMTFTGSQGLGKTYMAKKISEVLEREFIEINCGAITTFKDFVEKILIEKVLGEKIGESLWESQIGTQGSVDVKITCSTSIETEFGPKYFVGGYLSGAGRASFGFYSNSASASWAYTP